ncbi:MAG: TolC family protein [Chitinispirillaceae bacterium]
MQRWYLLISLLLLMTVAESAQQSDTVSFSKAREVILNHNFGIKAAQSRIEAARADVEQAKVYPNPEVSIGLGNLGVGEIEIGAAQKFELGGKRKLRRETALSEVRAYENSHKLVEAELEAEIVRRFIPIAVTEKKLALVDSVISNAQTTAEQITGRIEAGASRKTDLLRVEIELEQLQLERSGLERALNQARRRFASLGGNESSRLVNVNGDLNEAQIPALDSLLNAVALSPRMKAYELQIAGLETRKQQLRTEAVPDLGASAAYVRNNKEGANSVGVGFSMGLPLFNHNVDAQRSVEFQKKSLLEQQKNQLVNLRTDISDIHSTLLQIDSNINILLTVTIPKAQKVYGLIREYYNAGNTSFLDLISIQQELLQLEMELLDLKAERADAVTELMAITASSFDIVNTEE